MPEFNYSGINNSGNAVAGSIEASDIANARRILETQGVMIKSLKTRPNLTLKEWLTTKKIKEKDIFLFTKYLGVVLRAGIPILKCIDILHNQVENLRFKKKLAKVKSDVEGGLPLAEAFGKHDDIFPSIYINLLHVGEESGLLFEMVMRLTSFYEKNSALRKKVKKATIYPIVIIVIAFFITIFLLFVIVPKFEEMFASFGSTLPGITLFVLGLSRFVQNNILYIIGGIFGVITSYKYIYKKSFKFRRTIDVLTMKIPLIGPLVIKYAVASFTSNLGILLKAGLPITKAMNITVNTIDNIVINEQMSQVKEDVEGGINITDAFRKAPVMPTMVVEMINIGDQSGILEDMLTNISEFYEEEVDSLVDAVTGMIEPIFMLFLGVVIGTLVLSMFLPIFKMSQAVKME
ncbi:MAG: type II secretion system F family protein [Candidatus Muirbacterium halophilum]|nr:type II secretion system F family protein [Candidatus Muirbacterium halophilum]MCK9475454.1 type II secretion system F family protein [Candidatus Muirbacterium halophilum]